MAETGRAQLYLDTHKKQDGTYVNEAAKEICVSFFFIFVIVEGYSFLGYEI